MNKAQKDLITQIHQEACLQKKDTYVDPLTGYSVFTEYHHLNRGYCCNSGCRHCPYKATPKPPASEDNE